MSVSTRTDSVQPERITSFDAKRIAGFLAIPMDGIRQHGQAAQTLAAVIDILRSDGKRTFRRQSAIAKVAGLSLSTVRRHLMKLEADGVVKIDRDGDTTNTVSLISPEAELMAAGFVPIPRYALHLPWSERVVLGWFVYRSAVSMDGSTCTDGAEAISKALGLSVRAVRYAFAGLVESGFVSRESVLNGLNGLTELLAPSTEPTPAKMNAPPQRGAKMNGDPCKSERGTPAKVSGQYLGRNNKNVPRSMDHRFSVDELTPVAAEVFRRAGYRRDDGGNLWKLAGLLVAGLISERELWDACHGCRECSPSDRPAYVVAIVKKHLADRGADLRELLGRVRIQPTWPKGPPKTVESERAEKQAESMAELLKRRGFA